MLNPQLLALAIGALVVVGAYSYLTDNVDADPLADAESGVATNVIVHAAIFDGGTGAAASAASIKFTPVKASAASFAPKTMGFTFAPLCQDADACNYNPTCTPLGISTDQSSLAVPTATVSGTTQTTNGAPVPNVQVHLYKRAAGSSIDAYSGTTTSTGVGVLGKYTWTGQPTAAGMSAYVLGTKAGYCSGSSTRIHAAAPTQTCAYGYAWSGSGCTYVGACAANYVWTGSGCTYQPPTSGGGQPGGACTAWNDPAFRSFLSSRGKNPDCYTDTENLWQHWMSQSQTGSANVQQGAASGSALIPVTITGDVLTKNLAKDVTIDAEVTIQTAAQKTIKRTIPAVTVSAAGGKIEGLTTNIDIPKADLGTGRTTITVQVRATSQDFLGASKASTGSIAMEAVTDYTGSVQINVRAASFASNILLAGGDERTITRTLAPVSIMG